MRWRGSVCVGMCLGGALLADGVTVFRAAHDSSKEMRRWMGEIKKKS